MMKSAIVILSPLLLLLNSCWPASVSFNDTGSLNPCLKLFYMEVLENNAPNAPINYSNELTEAIKSGIQNNTRLLITDETNHPQVIITGTITNYAITPVALQEGDNSAQNRLTISANMQILFSCPDEKYEQEMTMTSSRFVDYDSNTDISAVESELLTEINTQIVQDVVNKLLSNW